MFEHDQVFLAAISAAQLTLSKRGKASEQASKAPGSQIQNISAGQELETLCIFLPRLIDPRCASPGSLTVLQTAGADFAAVFAAAAGDMDRRYMNSDADAKRTPFANDASIDLEARRVLASKSALFPDTDVAAEYKVAASVKISYLACWFLLNLCLTLYNKAVIQQFPYPWLLTCLHCTFVSIGCFALNLNAVFQLSRLSNNDQLILAAFSCLFTLNIAISNVSLALVSVPFHQTVRALGPFITIIIQRICFRRSYSVQTYTSNFVIIVGVVMVTFGEYHFTVAGFTLTLLGIILASIKGVVSNRLMTGRLALPALEILLRLSPLAALQALLYASFNGECGRLSKDFSVAGRPSFALCAALFGNGAVAFAVNFFSFQTNKQAGALTLSIAGNLKQCFTILLGVALFRVPVGWLDGMGMAVALGGATWYSSIELKARAKR